VLHSQRRCDRNLTNVKIVGEHEERWDLYSLAWSIVKDGKTPLQQLIPAPRCVVEVKARLLVVAKVREHARVDVDEVRPIWVVLILNRLLNTALKSSHGKRQTVFAREVSLYYANA
jgi:hypothetical protein